MPRMRCRVVCALDVMMDKSRPTSTLSNVDLPTFGLPTILTKPDLCVFFLHMGKCSERRAQRQIENKVFAFGYAECASCMMEM